MLNVLGVDGAGQTEMHTAESVALEPSALVIQMPAEKIIIMNSMYW